MTNHTQLFKGNSDGYLSKKMKRLYIVCSIRF